MTNRPQVLVRSRTEIESGRIQGGRLISIAGHNGPYPKIQRDQWTEVLDLRFDDVAMTEWISRNQVWRGPTVNDLQVALAFAKADEQRLVVHCEQGKSRSTGVALAILASRLGPGNETEAVENLLSAVIDPDIVQPNPLLVRYADEVLGRNGAIENAILSKCPRYVSWLAYWKRNGARQS